jgi:hypothetical protein
MTSIRLAHSRFMKSEPAFCKDMFDKIVTSVWSFDPVQRFFASRLKTISGTSVNTRTVLFNGSSRIQFASSFVFKTVSMHLNYKVLLSTGLFPVISFTSLVLTIRMLQTSVAYISKRRCVLTSIVFTIPHVLKITFSEVLVDTKSVPILSFHFFLRFVQFWYAAQQVSTLTIAFKEYISNKNIFYDIKFPFFTICGMQLSKFLH